MGAGLDRLVRELVMVQGTGSRRVGMLKNVHAEFERLETRWKGRLEQNFKNYGIPGTTMPKEQFNSEGRHPTGGPRSKDLQLYAFKAFQHRLYGPSISIDGVETFVGLWLVTDKKRNKANPKLLQSVARSFQPYLD